MNAPLLNRILYVEDEESIGRLAKMALHNLGGFAVEVCASPALALEKFREFQPDLILLDVMLPGMDGLSFFKLLRENPKTREIPVIFMTAKIQPQEILSYRNLGALGVIPKPFYPRTLASEIRTIWERHHAK